MLTVKFIKLNPDAKTPCYATSGAAAADLSACIEKPITLWPGQRELIPTGIAIELPNKKCVALLYARSGLAVKNGVNLINGVGVIDSDYRGEIKVPLVNTGDAFCTITPGQRVAQLCIAPVYLAQFSQVGELNDTARGENGFGSTGC